MAIKYESGTPLVALYYVLHIFPGSVIAIIILFEWLAKDRKKLTEVPKSALINSALHRAYYLILLALPVTGIAIFFDFISTHPFYQLHTGLFNLLLILVLVNIIHMMILTFNPNRR